MGSKVFLVTHQCQGDLLPTQLGFYCGRRVKSERLELKEGDTDLVPVAVMLSGMAVILQNLGDGALVDAL